MVHLQARSHIATLIHTASGMLALSTWSEVQNSRDQSLAEIYFTRSCTINYLMAWKGFPFSMGAPIFQISGDLESPELSRYILGGRRYSQSIYSWCGLNIYFLWVQEWPRRNTSFSVWEEDHSSATSVQDSYSMVLLPLQSLLPALPSSWCCSAQS